MQSLIKITAHACSFGVHVTHFASCNGGKQQTEAEESNTELLC